jgi:TetR/AcrR family transcriptional repressor of mexJK operon
MSGDMTRQPESGRREVRKRERRALIIAAARESFLTSGYAGMSMSGLLQTLGGSKSTLWGYFPSKEDLFAAVLEDVAANLHAELADIFGNAPSLESGVRNFNSAFLSTLAKPDSIAIWRLIVAEISRFPKLGQLFHERAAQYPERLLSEFLQNFIGTDLRDEDPQEMAEFLTGLCASHINRLMFDPHYRQGSGKALADHFTALFLRAYSRIGLA